MNVVDQQAQQAGEAVGAAQVAALAAPDNPAAAQAIAAENKTQAVGAMQAGFCELPTLMTMRKTAVEHCHVLLSEAQDLNRQKACIKAPVLQELCTC